jgi:hypothetical protein
MGGTSLPRPAALGVTRERAALVGAVSIEDAKSCRMFPGALLVSADTLFLSARDQ